ncbi:hypothetical protein ACQP3C_27780, partial [Escherichia coli]
GVTGVDHLLWNLENKSNRTQGSIDLEFVQDILARVTDLRIINRVEGLNNITSEPTETTSLGLQELTESGPIAREPAWD